MSTLIAIGIILLPVIIVITIVTFGGLWKVFQKAGLETWKSIVPIYNFYCLYKMTWGNGWLFFLNLIPIPFLSLILSCVTGVKLARLFGEGSFFGVCLCGIFSSIGYCILGFGNAQYIGNEPAIETTMYSKNVENGTANTKRYCASCGQEQEIRSKFCMKCGREL